MSCQWMRCQEVRRQRCGGRGEEAEVRRQRCGGRGAEARLKLIGFPLPPLTDEIGENQLED